MKKYSKNFVKLFISSIFVFVANMGYSETPIISGYDLAQPVMAKNGMVATREKRATDIGVEILKQGGNAVDAAVAVGFALAVSYPRAGNLGGGGFMMIHMKNIHQTFAIDYREMAPAKAHKDMMLDMWGNVDREKAMFSGLSSGVPGSVRGMELALNKFGTMSLKEVIAPAITLAEKGFAVSYDLTRALEYKKSRFYKWPATMEIFFDKNNQAIQPGEILIQKDLANTLKLISEKGSDGFYRGEVAEKIAKAVQDAGGVMTVNDLGNYRAKLRKPTSGTYRGYEIHSMPLPSSGGIHLIQLLNILENTDIGKLGHNSSSTIHHMAEAMKYVYADRSKYLGDPDFVKVPTKTITSKVYAKDIFKKINPNKATPSSEIKPGNLIPYESDQTTQISIVDKWGNAVSVTTTLNFSFGSGMVAAGTGLFMNNEMDDFSSKPGVPNAYGLLGGAANAIEKGKRPLSAMTPTIVLKDGVPFLITGSPGGSRIITTTLQVIMNVIDHKMNVAEAVSATRIHHQWFPEEIRIEKSLNKDTIKILESKGHTVKIRNAMGSAQSIMITPEWIFGISDPRSLDGKAAGY